MFSEEYNGFFAGKSALVTGGAGFIGSHLTQHLTRLGCHVHVLDNFSSGHRSNLDGIDASLTEGSILDSSALAHAINGCSIVFHEAAFISVPQSIEQPDLCNEINVQGTKKVIDAATNAGCTKMVFASSAACYGSTPSLPSTETDQLSLESPYAQSKFEGEHLVTSATHLRGVSLRYFNVFGERQDPRSQYAAVVSAFLHAIHNNQTPVIFGDGSQTRDFTHVSNIVHANLLAASHQEHLKHNVFNVGTGNAFSLVKLLQTMMDEVTPDIDFQQARIGDVQQSCANIALIKQSLGYQPIVNTAKAMRALVNPTQG